MSIRNRLAVALIMTVLSTTASGDGINNPPVVGKANSVGAGEGINILGVGGGSGPPPVGCAGTGFDFTLACNSQYVSVF